MYDLSQVGSEKITGKSCFQTYARKMALKIQRIDLSRKFKKWV
jgi:hypothetical protein